jgi:hypothetical protein
VDSGESAKYNVTFTATDDGNSTEIDKTTSIINTSDCDQDAQAEPRAMRPPRRTWGRV